MKKRYKVLKGYGVYYVVDQNLKPVTRPALTYSTKVSAEKVAYALNRGHNIEDEVFLYDVANS